MSDLEYAIHDTDPNAQERMRERIANWETERAAYRAFNQSCRRTVGGNVDFLTPYLQVQLASIKRVCAWQLGERGQLPAYIASNLGNSIRRMQERLLRLERAE